MEILVAGTTWPEADALILPTNDYLWMATGPAAEVKAKAGAEVEIAAVRQGPIPVGEVVVTEAGGLSLKGILHAAVMGQDREVAPEAAASATRRALEISATRKWGRLLLHSLRATGRSTRRAAVQAGLGAMIEWLLDGPPVQQITLLATDDAEKVELHQDLLRLIQTHG